MNLVIDVQHVQGLTSRNSIEAVEETYGDPFNPLVFPTLLIVDGDVSLKGAFAQSMAWRNVTIRVIIFKVLKT